jgi:outer membrane receptor protein involved in Fe transport
MGTFASARESDSNKRESDSLEEIFVTATKRGGQNVNDTAMSISAIGSGEIQDRVLVGLADILNSLPSMSFLDQGPGYNSVVLRGVSTSPQTDATQSDAISGVYFGETPLSGFGIQGNSVDLKLVDIERIEVLRGPQGTLYGGGAMGGVIRNIPAAPNLNTLERSVTAGYSLTGKGGGDNTSTQGVVNLPVIEDKLALRIVGYHFGNSGYYNNVAASDPTTSAAAATFGAVTLDQDDVGSSTYSGGRVSLLWQPSNSFSITLGHLLQNIKQDGWGQADLGVGDGVFSQRRFQMRQSNNLPAIGEPVSNEGLKDKISVSNALIEYDFGSAKLTSSTSYTDENSALQREVASSLGFLPAGQSLSYGTKSFVEEVRLSTVFDGPLNLIAGAYYEDRERFTASNATFGGRVNNPFADLLLINNRNDQRTEQVAVFGEAYYGITDTIKITMGGRYFDFKRAVTDTNYSSALVPVDAVTVIKNSEDGTSLKAGVEYRPTTDALVYASWGQGFRLGFPSPADNRPICDVDGDGLFDGTTISTGPRTVKSDTVDNYEVGGKFGLFNNRLQINAAVFRVDWKGIPVNTRGAICGALTNAGQARSQGVELESTLAVVNDLVLHISGSYVDAELTEDAPLSLATKGDRLAGSPKYNFSLGAEQSFRALGRDAFIRADYSYIGGYYNNLKQTGTEQGDYGLLNISTGIEVQNVNFIVFAQNVTDEDALTWIDADLFEFERGNRLRPRTIGIRAAVEF